jgi:hypothetical protein
MPILAFDIENYLIHLYRKITSIRKEHKVTGTQSQTAAV